MDFPNYLEGFSEDNPPPFFFKNGVHALNSTTTASPPTESYALLGAAEDLATATVSAFLNLTARRPPPIGWGSNSSGNPGIPSEPPPAVNSTSALLEQYTLFHVARFINQYYLWLVFAFGFPGNIVSFITVIHMKPFTSPTMYVAALALVDNTCLTCKLLFLLLTKYDAPLGDGGCSVLIFLGSFTAQFANWLLVAMTVERCLAICVPLKVGSICTRKLHIAGIVVIATTLTANNAQHFITNEMQNSGGDIVCDTSDEYTSFMEVWLWVDAMFYAILPAILLVIMNTLLILGIRRSAQIQRELTGKATQVVETMRQQRQITIMLIIVCVAFVVLITPNAIFYAVKRHWVYAPYSYEHVKYLFTSQLIFLLCDSTHAVNFYLYFLSNRRFRKRCLETVMFCSAGSRRRSRSLRSSATSGVSNAFRMSMTEVTTSIPSNASVPLRHFSSSSISSSSSSMGRGRHVLVKNGGNRENGSVRKFLIGGGDGGGGGGGGGWGGGGGRGKGDKCRMTKTRFGRSDGSTRYTAVS